MAIPIKQWLRWLLVFIVVILFAGHAHAETGDRHGISLPDIPPTTGQPDGGAGADQSGPGDAVVSVRA